MKKTKLGSNATFNSTQLGVTVIGEHAYAYNTAVASSTASTILSFTTGKYYIHGTLDLKLNGTTVIILKTETEVEDMPTSVRCPILIPPLTTVTAEIDCNADEASQIATVVLTGRVY